MVDFKNPHNVPYRVIDAFLLRRFGRVEQARSGRQGYFFQNEFYSRDGYLEKEFRITHLDAQNIQPSLDEIARFQGGAVDEASADAQIDLSAINNQYRVGEVVVITSGDMIHQSGTVVKVIGPTVIVRIDDTGRELEVESRILRKFFREGDHVKVINGVHKNQTGLIVKVEDQLATLISDLTMHEVSVFVKDIVRATDQVAEVTAATHQYDVHDLVQLEYVHSPRTSSIAAIS